MNALNGKKTYAGIAGVITGLALHKLAPNLPPDVAAVLTPDVVDLVSQALEWGGVALAAVGRYLAKPADKQDVVTARPQA